MLSDKYIAGFMDSDGCVSINWRPLTRDAQSPMRRAYLSMEFWQHKDHNEVLKRIQERIGGAFEENAKPLYSRLRLNGANAEKALNRFRKHLVIKRHYANAVCELLGDAHDPVAAKVWLNQQRRIQSMPLPNFPPRKWLAGYFDGDGSVQVRLPKGKNAAQVTLQIASSSYDDEGIRILEKSFGGSLHTVREGIAQWVLTMPPSKTKQVLGYFAKHSIVKKSQIDFILGCAEMGHYRDGSRIKQAVKQLKARPHRLSEPSVATLLAGIRDIETRRVYFRRKYTENGGCLRCKQGERKRAYYSDGLCKPCYQAQWIAA